MVGARFGGGIGRSRRVRRLVHGKGRPRRAIHRLRRSRHDGSGNSFVAAPANCDKAQRFLKQAISADDVGLNESAGPSIERSTWLSAARCMTTSGCRFSKTSRTASASAISIFSKLKRGLSAIGASEARFPAYVNLSSTQTEWSVSQIIFLTTADPMKPAPPVTTKFMPHPARQFDACGSGTTFVTWRSRRRSASRPNSPSTISEETNLCRAE